MKAHELLKALGQQSIGREILTEPIGEWQGGFCKIIEVIPDPGSPEIVFQVRHNITKKEIGVFEWEDIQLV